MSYRDNMSVGEQKVVMLQTYMNSLKKQLALLNTEYWRYCLLGKLMLI